MKVAISRVMENKDNMRRKGAAYEKHIATLMDSISVAGQRVPISVIENEDGQTFTVYDGNCRLDAMRRLGETEVDVVISDGLNFGAEALATQVRHSLDDTERMRAVQLALFSGINHEQISCAAGLTKKDVKRYEKAAKTQEKFSVPEATIEDIKLLAKVEKTCGADEAEKCLELIGTNSYQYTCHSKINAAKKEQQVNKFLKWVPEQIRNNDAWKGLFYTATDLSELDNSLVPMLSYGIDYVMAKKFVVPESAVGFIVQNGRVFFVKRCDDSGTIPVDDFITQVSDSDGRFIGQVLATVYDNCKLLRDNFIASVPTTTIKKHQAIIMQTFLETCIQSKDANELFSWVEIECAKDPLFLMWNIVAEAHGTLQRSTNQNSSMDSWAVLYGLLCLMGYQPSPIELALLDYDYDLAEDLERATWLEKEKESSVVNISDIEDLI